MAHSNDSEIRRGSTRLKLDSQTIADLSSTRSLSQRLGVEAESTPTSPACCTPTLLDELHDND